MNQRRRAHAFTLLEIIAGLVVVGLITAVGVRVLPELLSRNSLSEVESTLQRAALAQTAYAARYGQYTESAAEMSRTPTGRGLTFSTGSSTNPGVVSVHLGDDGSLLLAALSSDGRCVGLLLGEPVSDATLTDIPASEPSSCNASSLRFSL
jgi:type II secretory pathway pseudopilin PulG